MGGLAPPIQLFLLLPKLDGEVVEDQSGFTGTRRFLRWARSSLPDKCARANRLS
jgi:hypothetical protein